MNKEVINQLVALDIFKNKQITEEEYNKYNGVDTTALYSKLEYKWDDNKIEKIYSKTDTKDLTLEEINLLLKIDQTQNIRSIEKAARFFVVMAVINIILTIIGAVLITNMF